MRDMRLRALAMMMVLWLATSSGSPGLALAPAAQPTANEVLQSVIQHELKAQAADHSHWEYRSLSSEKGGSEKEVIQTKDGEIERTMSVKAHAPTPAEQDKDKKRIEKLLEDRALQRKRQRDASEDGRKSEHLLKVLPQAVIATYGLREGDLLDLNFKPNPRFHPSSHEDQVFHSMEGSVRLNMKEQRLAEIQGHLIQAVKFGGGILGYLDKGGEFHVQQSEVAPGYWEITLMKVQMRGKALFFKTISVHQDEQRKDFRRVSDNLTLQQGAAVLWQQTAVR